jgi:hypothetical protein
VAARSRQAETEAAPIRYVSELVGVDTDSERPIRWLIALMVLCCDPLAIVLTAAASAAVVQVAPGYARSFATDCPIHGGGIDLTLKSAVTFIPAA